MRYRKLTADGDYTFGNSQADFWRDVPEAVGQSVMTRILLWTGEWFLDTNEGTPFMIGVLGKKSKEMANVTIQERMLQSPGMVDLEDFQSEIDPETRRMRMQTSINTIYGPTALQVTNYGNF